MNRKNLVKLTEEQRQHLEKLITSGTSPARILTRARILLKSDISENGSQWSYERIAEAFDGSEMLIRDVRKRFTQAGFEAALRRKKPEREYEHSLDGEAEAHLMTLACSQPVKITNISATAQQTCLCSSSLSKVNGISKLPSSAGELSENTPTLSPGIFPRR